MVLSQITCVTVSLLLVLLSKQVMASTGDRSQMFYSCLQKCLTENCTGNVKLEAFTWYLNILRLCTESSTVTLPFHLRLLHWTCPDECKYECMWPTNDWFVEAGIGVQQFHGKVILAENS